MNRCPQHLQFGVIISHFSRVTIFAQFFGSTFSICLMILCTPIPIVFLLGLLTWGFHNHFVKVRYTTRRPIERSIICFGSLSHYLPYNNNPPYLCFPFIGRWHTYNSSCIKCGFCFFMIGARIFSIRTFDAANEMCNLVSASDKPFYISSFWFFYSWLGFSYFGRTDGI